MQDKQIKLVIGSLLHDIGKVVYRAGDGRQHSACGYDFLRQTRKDFDSDILDCVRYHHVANLKGAQISQDALAYVTYFSDNVAAAMDRREGMDIEDGFERTIPLDSVFNILNGNHGNAHYRQQMMNPKEGINYPTTEASVMDESFYNQVVDRIKDNLQGIEISEEYINSLLSVLEATLSYIPSSTSKRELADISLYDHVRMTAAVAECCLQYMEEHGIFNYYEFLYKDSDKSLWTKPMFLLYSMDISGVQNFIYTINTAGALRGLRARSFYLELLMEHIVDELLERLELSRSCLIYTGGGHCYMLLPNTGRVKEILDAQCHSVNAWFMEKFDTALYIADGYIECNANNLKNEPQGSYSDLFHTVSRNISSKKSHRYSANELNALNRRHREGKRECIVCRRTAKLNGEERCPICAALEKLSGAILYQNYFVTMLEGNGSEDCIPLPCGKCLRAGNEQLLRNLMDNDNYVRSYTVNESYTGRHVTTKLWVGRYTTGDTFEELAKKSVGIERLAVLRADVDNLGNTFVNGFKDTGDGRYETLSRTATLSRQLSLFFKLHLNWILENGESRIFSLGGKRQVCIVYSGGDDLFFVGAWNEIIDSFIDVKKALELFTQGTLTISGGIGIYDSSFPINRMALEVANLEDFSKEFDGKNAITLFDESGRYGWKTFLDQVVEEKYLCIYEYMTSTNNKGKAFLYNLLELLRNNGEPFNRARFVYYLSRMEPDADDKGNLDEMSNYHEFSAKMYKWSLSEEERRQTVTAIYLYVYIKREKEGEKQDAD